MILAIYIRLETPDMRELPQAADALDELSYRLRWLKDSDRLPLKIKDRTGLEVGACSFIRTSKSVNLCPACRDIKKRTGTGHCNVCWQSW